MMIAALGFFRHRSPITLTCIAIALVGLISIVDYLLPGFSLAVFYLIPIALVAGPVGARAGTLVAALSVVALIYVDINGVQARPDALTPWWNGGIHLVFYGVVVFLLVTLRQEMEREEANARTDPVTSAGNRRAFFEHLTAELDRARRYHTPFALALLDLDDFKSVNDYWGHDAGDRLLRIIVDALSTNLRAADRLARIGGDEFAILLPQTTEQDLEPMFEKLRLEVDKIVRGEGYTTTFSCGVVGFRAAPESASAALSLADDLMYEQKRAGKGLIRLQRWPVEAAPAIAEPARVPRESPA